MTFNEFYKAVKKKFEAHKEIVLDCDKLSVQISDLYNNSFYILWENEQITIEPYPYNDKNVCITSSQDHLELLFEERQYIFSGQKFLNIQGSFVDVMKFQKLISFITKDNGLKIQEEIITNMLLKQDMITKDLEMIMESIQLLLVNSLLEIPNKSINCSLETENEKNNETHSRTNRKKKSTHKKVQ